MRFWFSDAAAITAPPRSPDGLVHHTGISADPARTWLTLCANSARVGAALKAALAAKLANEPGVTEIRGVGLMIGVELATPPLAGAVAQLCFKRGLLLLECGKKAIRLSPPLILIEAQAAVTVEIFAQAVADARAAAAA